MKCREARDRILSMDRGGHASIIPSLREHLRLCTSCSSLLETSKRVFPLLQPLMPDPQALDADLEKVEFRLRRRIREGVETVTGRGSFWNKAGRAIPHGLFPKFGLVLALILIIALSISLFMMVNEGEDETARRDEPVRRVYYPEEIDIYEEFVGEEPPAYKGRAVRYFYSSPAGVREVSY